MTNVVPLPRRVYGATPDEWLHFSLLVGDADLLPVVSRPGAQISAASTLKGLGKTPSTFNPSGHVVGIPKWTQKHATAADVARWQENPDHGICIITRAVRGLDVDVPDPDLADRISMAFQSALFGGVHGGHLPTRIRAGTGKRLLAFRLVGSFAKRSFRLPEGQGLVELLCDGQQFVAIGTHPSGTRYEWVDGLPDLIPEFTQAHLEQAWISVRDEFAESDSEGSAGVDRNRPDLDGVLDPVAAYLDGQGLVLGVQGEKLFTECPWKEGHTGDSGISETCWLVAGSKGFEQGHFQCMHASCQQRGDGDFLDAIGYRVAAFEDLGPESDDAATVGRSGEADLYLQPWPKFKRDGKGAIEATLENVITALGRGDLCGFTTLAYDTFRDQLLINGRTFRDHDAVTIRKELEKRGFKPVGRELIRDALLVHADTSAYDSAQEWLAGLPAWDGVERVETFLPRLFSVGDTPYTRACSRYLWTALAGRVVEPGVKADMALILQGEQGQYKSWAIKAMCPPELAAFREIGLHKLDADLSRKLRGCLVGELAELRGLRTRDAESIRAWMVQTEERWVEKWQTHETVFQRRCVFVASANPTELLDDDTGERRWLPMTVNGSIDLAAVRAERDQLWAEGLVRFSLLGIEWQDAEQLAKAEHGKFKVREDIEPVIQTWLDQPLDVSGETPNQRGWVTSHDVMSKGLGLDVRAYNQSIKRSVGKTMRGLGWRDQAHRVDGEAIWAWVRKM